MGQVWGACVGVYEDWEGLEGPAFITMVGLDGGGKTSMCLKLIKSEERPRQSGIEDRLKTNRMSAMRMNEWVVSLPAQPGKCIHIVDVGGKGEFHESWTKRYSNALVLLFVIDASNVARWPEAIAAYKKYVVCHLLSARVPAIFVLNKMDLVKDGVVGITPEMVKEGLELDDPDKGPDTYDICLTSVNAMEGLTEMLDATLLLLHAFKTKNGASVMVKGGH